MWSGVYINARTLLPVRYFQNHIPYNLNTLYTPDPHSISSLGAAGVPLAVIWSVMLD